MSHHRILRNVKVIQSPRVMQMSGMFDVPPTEVSEQTWEFDIDLPPEWNIGLILGPSGSGKTTVAREIFGDSMVEGWDWSPDRSILDDFPKDQGIKDILNLLSSVGFSSPPSWLRPYRVLSNGEQFRVSLARTLAESPTLAVVDEFSSVVDRQVAQIASAALAKTVRRRQQKFVAVSCHYDVIDWLDPDWIFQPQTGQLERRLLQGRPKVSLEIYRADRFAWKQFKHHHYLSANLHKAAQCFVACINKRMVGFNSYLHFPHAKVKDIKIGHRLVVLPDYQGLGIGGAFEEWVGQYLFQRGYRYHNVTSHPALVAYCARSPRWKMTARGDGFYSAKRMKTTSPVFKTGDASGGSRKHIVRNQNNPRRLATFTFEYIPDRPSRKDNA